MEIDNLWYNLFTIYFYGAEHYNTKTIREIAIREFEKYKDDIEKLTYLVMVINHLSWHYNSVGNDELSQLYADLYYEYYEKAIDYLESEGRDEELTYFIRTLD